VAFSRQQYLEVFFGAQIGGTPNSIWQISAHIFGLGLNFVGEIEWQIFAKRCALVTFRRANKVW
jgi:hypothetical protein